MLRAFLAACTLFLLAAHAQDLTKNRRVALVIGNSNYTQLPKVPSARADAEAITEALRKAGFDVVRIPDFTVTPPSAPPSATDIFTVGSVEFEKHLKPGDVCLVYYAGYSVQSEGDNYLLPVNFDPQGQGRMQDRALLFATLPETLDVHGAALKIFVIEGPPPINVEIKGAANGLANPQIGGKDTQKSLFLSGGRLGDSVTLGAGGVDLLTRLAAKAINEQKVDLEALFLRVKNEVGETSGGRQIPFYDSSVLGTHFYFHEPEKLPPPPPPTKPEWPRTGQTVQNRKDHEEYLWIKNSTFQMGCVPGGEKPCDSAEKPRHQVILTKGFWMGLNEVQVDSYMRYVAQNSKIKMPKGPLYDSHWKEGTHPMVDVRWEEAQAYCTWAGGRLPTEAEWEFAARGGKRDEIYPMNSENSRDSANFLGKSGADIFDDVAPVRKFSPNPYGLFDMAGNVWEWVNDVFGDYSAAAVSDRWYGPNAAAAAFFYLHRTPIGFSVEDPKGPPTDKEHAIRGGSYNSDPKVHLRISYRRGSGKDNLNIGFRCAIDDTAESRKLLPSPDANQ